MREVAFRIVGILATLLLTGLRCDSDTEGGAEDAAPTQTAEPEPEQVGELVAIECGRNEADVLLGTKLSWHLNKPTTKPPVVYLESLDAKGKWAEFGSFETKPGEVVEVVMGLPAAPYSLRLRWKVEPPERSLHWELRAWV